MHFQEQRVTSDKVTVDLRFRYVSKTYLSPCAFFFSQISKKVTFLFIGDRLIPPGFVKFSEIERGIFSGFWLKIKIDKFRAVLRSGIQCRIDTFF